MKISFVMIKSILIHKRFNDRKKEELIVPSTFMAKMKIIFTPLEI